MFFVFFFCVGFLCICSRSDGGIKSKRVDNITSKKSCLRKFNVLTRLNWPAAPFKAGCFSQLVAGNGGESGGRTSNFSYRETEIKSWVKNEVGTDKIIGTPGKILRSM